MSRFKCKHLKRGCSTVNRFNQENFLPASIEFFSDYHSRSDCWYMGCLEKGSPLFAGKKIGRTIGSYD
ncbi:MAG: hypothetical protein V4714_07230 [Bacteroidota bacterium]